MGERKFEGCLHLGGGLRCSVASWNFEIKNSYDHILGTKTAAILVDIYLARMGTIIPDRKTFNSEQDYQKAVLDGANRVLLKPNPKCTKSGICKLANNCTWRKVGTPPIQELKT